MIEIITLNKSYYTAYITVRVGKDQYIFVDQINGNTIYLPCEDVITIKLKL